VRDWKSRGRRKLPRGFESHPLRLIELPEDLSLTIDRVLPARAPVVFGAFADAEMLRTWWGPKGFTIPSLTFEPRAGEPYRIEMQPPDGDAFHLTGVFSAVAPGSRLAFTFVWEPADPDDVETLVELTFHGVGESTEVSLEQGAFKTEERRELHRAGWTDSLDRLEAILSENG
jgi:uncharacterized protein YndB with AHSA1/START domain